MKIRFRMPLAAFRSGRVPGTHCLAGMVLALGASGCATLEDFRNMAPAERARTVCESRPDYAGIQRNISELDKSIAEANEALRKGVRVYRQCNQVKVYGDKVTTCSTVGNTTQCRESRPARFEKQCLDVLLPIDAQQERDNRKGWVADRKRLQDEARQLYQTCYQSVVKMNAEDAYSLY